jgi:hypothetical protein
MRDDQTRSIWDHITGQAIDGPLKGHQLDIWPMTVTTFEAELGRDRGTQLARSNYRSIQQWLFSKTKKKAINEKGFIPPFFHLTMSTAIDDRLPKLAQGLGVFEDQEARFYPMNCLEKGQSLQDNWGSGRLRVQRDAVDGMLQATWQETGEQPMQLLTRWYGFSFTFPNCSIYGVEAQPA